jgi:hypothetical protein
MAISMFGFWVMATFVIRRCFLSGFGRAHDPPDHKRNDDEGDNPPVKNPSSAVLLDRNGRIIPFMTNNSFGAKVFDAADTISRCARTATSVLSFTSLLYPPMLI